MQPTPRETEQLVSFQPVETRRSPAEVTQSPAGPAGPELRPPCWLMSCPQDADVTRDDLWAMMMKPVVMATLPEETLFHFTVRNDAREAPVCGTLSLQCSDSTDKEITQFTPVSE